MNGPIGRWMRRAAGAFLLIAAACGGEPQQGIDLGDGYQQAALRGGFDNFQECLQSCGQLYQFCYYSCLVSPDPDGTCSDSCEVGYHACIAGCSDVTPIGGAN